MAIRKHPHQGSNLDGEHLATNCVGLKGSTKRGEGSEIRGGSVSWGEVLDPSPSVAHSWGSSDRLSGCCWRGTQR